METQGAETTTRELWESADRPTSARVGTEGASAVETAGDALYDPATNTIDPALPAGDPVVDKVRTLLQEGQMVVKGREIHDGIETWAISLKPDVDRPVWTLWVCAADGKPVELRDPGRDASEQSQVIRWSAYEVLRGSDSGRLLTLTGAHPSAHVVHDPAQGAAARRLLLPPKR